MSREVRYVVKDLKSISYEYETEALADFKYNIQGRKLNSEVREELTKGVEEAVCSGKEVPLNMAEALAFMQPKMFTKGRNMYSQVKDPVLKLDFFSK